MPVLDINKIKKHQQKYDKSCTPSSIEMVLKLENICNETYYDLQEHTKDTSIWGGDFNNKSFPLILPKIIFKHEFGNDRNFNFPFQQLFDRIDAELNNNRFVIITLRPDGGNFHNYILYDHSHDDEYVAITRFHKVSNPTWESRVKLRVLEMKGTDIITYTKM